jgi:hypothetical protein
MARRIILGQYGSAYRFRVSQAGYDAATADLDGLIFDADAIPAKILTTGLLTITNATSTSSPGQASASHGSDPTLVIGVAQSQYPGVNGGVSQYRWFGVRQLSSSNGGGISGYAETNELDTGWCSPWYYFQDDQDGTTHCGGWKLFWDGSTVRVENHSGYQIKVRWTALSF